jgi:PiT family inorganic phosphate transporter
MFELVLVLAFAATFYIGWNIGANDTANAMGTSVGAQVLSFRRAVMLLAIFVILGAMLEGYKVMKPVGEGIITDPEGGASPLSSMPEVVVVSMLTAGLWVSVATYLGVPVSTHQAIIGALVGAGFAMSVGGAVPTEVHTGKLLTIFAAWVLTPLGAAFFAYIIYKAVSIPLRKMRSITALNLFFSASVLLSGCYVAYVMGANDVGTAMAAMYAVGKDTMRADFSQTLALFGAVAVAVGGITYGKKVMRTIGEGITRLEPVTAFVAQLAAAITVHTFTQWGLPVSTSQSIVGGVMGAGLVKGTRAVKGRKMASIAATWVVTTLAAMLVSFALTWTLHLF